MQQTHHGKHSHELAAIVREQLLKRAPAELVHRTTVLRNVAVFLAALVPCTTIGAQASAEESDQLAALGDAGLTIPELSVGKPAAGARVVCTPPEYAGTSVAHTIFLPPNWSASGPSLPIIFEYTGNRFPTSGSTGRPEDAALGYGVSGGQFIWVSLPYVSKDGRENTTTWWGDHAATVEYAIRNVPRIIRDYHADPTAVFLCGFSRGAIAVSNIGLHNDEIASLWTAFVTHDHFDGVREWRRTTWGTPLADYRERAASRLRRIGSRPCLVMQNGGTAEIEDFLAPIHVQLSQFKFVDVSTSEIFGAFPNEHAKHPHTDRWLLQPSPTRKLVWKWVDRILADSSAGNEGSPSRSAEDTQKAAAD